jgi:hypothetical protein
MKPQTLIDLIHNPSSAHPLRPRKNRQVRRGSRQAVKTRVIRQATATASLGWNQLKLRRNYCRSRRSAQQDQGRQLRRSRLQRADGRVIAAAIWATVAFALRSTWRVYLSRLHSRSCARSKRGALSFEEYRDASSSDALTVPFAISLIVERRLQSRALRLSRTTGGPVQYQAQCQSGQAHE